MEICSDYKEGELLYVRSHLYKGKILDERPWYLIKVPSLAHLSKTIYMIIDYEDKIAHPHTFGIVNEVDIIWEKIDGPF